MRDATGGFVLNHNWFSGNDLYFFSKEPLATLEDFTGLKTRSHSAALSDWIEGIGGDAQFLAFAEARTTKSLAYSTKTSGHWWDFTSMRDGSVTQD